MTEDFKAEEFSLPLPELSKIEEIESTVMRACESVQGRHKLADYLLKTVGL